MSNIDSNQDKSDSEPQAETRGAGVGKPPNKTALGQDGDSPEELWQQELRSLRCFDIDSHPSTSSNEGYTVGRPIPHLSFVQIQPSLTENTESSHELVEHNLAALYKEKKSVAFYVDRRKNGTNYFFGVSLQKTTFSKTSISDQSASPSEDTTEALLKRVCPEIEIVENWAASKQITKSIICKTTFSGAMYGIPSFSVNHGQDRVINSINSVVSGLKGQGCGILILAEPIDDALVRQTKIDLENQMQRIRAYEDPIKRQRTGCYEEKVQFFIDDLTRGQETGSWLVAAYYFSPDARTFATLQNAINQTYASGDHNGANFAAREVNWLRKHIEQLHLLRDKQSENDIHTVFNYRFLTPLSSRCLADYIIL